MKKIRFLSIFLLAIFWSCGGNKTIVGTEDLRTNEVIKSYQENLLSFETVVARMRVRYEDKKQSQSLTVSLRMKKDETIWMTAKILGFTVAKAMITPNSVNYYEKINGTYFEGDFSLINDWLGQELNFGQLQNMLLGQAFTDLNAQSMSLEIRDQDYQLKPTHINRGIEEKYRLLAAIFKVSEQQLYRQSSNQGLQILYPEYNNIQGQPFPSKINITALDNGDKISIDATYKSVELDIPARFPYNVPSGYTRIEI